MDNNHIRKPDNQLRFRLLQRRPLPERLNAGLAQEVIQLPPMQRIEVFSYFIPFLLFIPCLIEICAGLKSCAEPAASMDTRPSIIESDLKAVPVPITQKLRGVAARTEIKPITSSPTQHQCDYPTPNAEV